MRTSPVPARARLGLLLALTEVLGAALVAWHPHWLLTERLPAPWAQPAFLAVFAAGTLAFVPKPVLSAAAGALFGIGQGLALAVAGTTLGALLAFGLGRWLGRDGLRPLLPARAWGALDRQLTDRGFRTMLMLRLFPGLPFPVVNYGASVSGVGTGTFVGATALGTVPGTAAYVAAGASATAPGSTALWLSLSAFITGVVLLGAVPLWVARRAAKAATAVL